MKKVIDWLIDKWLAGFITASIFFMLKLYLDLPEETKINFFRFAWLRELLETQYSLLTIIIIVSLIIVLTRIEKAIQKAKTKKTDYSSLKKPEYHFESYNRDVFGIKKTIWSWRYDWRAYERKFVIADLRPLCSQCETPMELNISYYSISADCHKCRLEGMRSSFPITEEVSDVEKEIIRRIENNEAKI